MSDTSYIGTSKPDQCKYEVRICNGGTTLELNPHFEMVNHSPTGFAWGYGGSGPAQLAFALLYDATGKEELARRWYQQYKAEVVSRLPKDWQIPIGAVSGWVRLKEATEEFIRNHPSPFGD